MPRSLTPVARLPVASTTPKCLRKARSLSSRKAGQISRLQNRTKSAESGGLREMAGEKEYWVSSAVSQCGGFHVKGYNYWALSRGSKAAENVGEGGNGGARGIRTPS